MIRYLREFAEATYVAALARPQTQRLNNALLRMAVLARGYGHVGPLAQTGEAAFIARMAAHGVGLCIDVGANAGEYSRALLERTPGTVVAFEPQPATFHRLAALQEAFPSRFLAVNAGVADVTGELELHWGANSQLASFSREINSIGYVRETNMNSSTVAVTTLDDFLEGVPGKPYAGMDLTLVKIDTEGYEYEVLKGTQRTLSNRRPKFVQIEFNHHQLFRGHTLYSMSKLLPSYIAYQILPGSRGLWRVSPEDPFANVFGYANFVFVRPDVRL
jgi:FkbM family methyltransferase